MRKRMMYDSKDLTQVTDSKLSEWPLQVWSIICKNLVRRLTISSQVLRCLTSHSQVWWRTRMKSWTTLPESHCTFIWQPQYCVLHSAQFSIPFSVIQRRLEPSSRDLTMRVSQFSLAAQMFLLFITHSAAKKTRVSFVLLNIYRASVGISRNYWTWVHYYLHYQSNTQILSISLS